MTFSLKRLSLLWRILLSTSIAITALFALTGWLVQSYAVRVGEQRIEEEVQTSLKAYQTLWTSRAKGLAAISRVISSMSDVRAAFLTKDRATIQDSAQELWARVSEENATFLVLSPDGSVIASLGGSDPGVSTAGLPFERIMKRFPNQVEGFLSQGSRLFYVILTPVYVQAGDDQGLLNILLAGFELDGRLAEELKQSTLGSEFAFVSGQHFVASTLPLNTVSALYSSYSPKNSVKLVKLNGLEYMTLATPLLDIAGNQIGQLLIVRSFGAARHALLELQHNVGIIWVAAVCIGLACTYLLAKRIVEPVKRLDRAASEVARRNYDFRVAVESEDELGRLAQTFNEMCDSIRSARSELIRQERIATIGKLCTSIVHDLRNPLAAIYGGAEMLVDSDLPPTQSKRLALNIYRASRRIQELLQDLVGIAGGKSKSVEQCSLMEVVQAAFDVIAPAADSQGIVVRMTVPPEVQLPLERARIERLFLNLLNNAVEAMPNGGQLQISATRDEKDVFVRVEDTGPGISGQIRESLFQPFVSIGKKNGLGLGLALARQTALDHGGDLWESNSNGVGASFWVRLPLHSTSS
jgi:signal transduction histidine kinase